MANSSSKMIHDSIIKYEPSHEPHLYECEDCDKQMIGETTAQGHKTGVISSCVKNRIDRWVARNIRPSKGQR